MISKAKLKYIHSLEQKKYRRQEGVFVAEGPKVVGDLLAVMPARELFATREWMASQPHLAGNVTEVTDDELRKLSFLQHPQQVLGVFEMPDASVTAGQSSLTQDATKVESQLALALDGVQDPGNLGTIIRLADWFDIGTIICSHDTADAWSPKVVQATMGSIARVNIVYTDLKDYLSHADIPICGTVLDGENIFKATLPKKAVVVMGNEGNGISADIRQLLTHRLLIPPLHKGPESLNVAIATAITCTEFLRSNAM